MTGHMQTVRAVYDRWISDDAAWWEDALGLLLGFGLFWRAGIHIWTVLIADAVADMGIDPRLVESDLSVRSPVRDLQGRRLDALARYLTALTGLFWWEIMGPFSAASPGFAHAYIAINLAVCFGDPLAYILERAHSRVTNAEGARSGVERPEESRKSNANG